MEKEKVKIYVLERLHHTFINEEVFIDNLDGTKSLYRMYVSSIEFIKEEIKKDSIYYQFTINQKVDDKIFKLLYECQFCSFNDEVDPQYLDLQEITKEKDF